MYDLRSLPIISKNDLKQQQQQQLLNDNQTSSMSKLSPIASKYSVRIQYETRDQFKKAAKMFGLMDDFKVRI